MKDKKPAWITGIALVLFAAAWFCVFMVFSSVVKYVSVNGLKSVAMRIWEGPKK